LEQDIWTLRHWKGLPRNQIQIATKFGIEKMEPKNVISSCDASLQRLGVEYIDLYNQGRSYEIVVQFSK